ncbi:hypothetical protein SmJEL517_g04049 [Synchytrium microbalum]|uniref:non-specific serine/threonine protein kinase n=1 Tax=Synchytrium microbalum TaxID=1806994 RepID=A0A507C5S2_9FUNG|nr:uncharacterized protein SmJEL517_g04049 [Synchytrium microbalum]TPX32893.1 hypothetical protein SmJEL517_g04049 [Synchytrium microbalum]
MDNDRYGAHRPHRVLTSPIKESNNDYRGERQQSPSSPTRSLQQPALPTASADASIANAPAIAIPPIPSQSQHSSTLAQQHQPLASSIVQNVARPRKVVADYRLTKTLGAGSMGKVKLAVHIQTGEKRACKIIPRPAGSTPYPEPISIGPTSSIRDFPAAGIMDQSKPPRSPPIGSSGKSKSPARPADDAKNISKEIRIIREAAIMLLLRHPHICALYEVVLLDEFYYMFFEYVAGGQLLDYIIGHGKLKEKNARRFVRQIVSAVDYCHQNSIVHRDLKIENVLIDKLGNIKLIDFGLSNLYSPGSQLQTFCGSLYFAAPELLNARAYTGPEVDIWSLGIILYVLVCGRVPFDDTSMPVLHSKIKAGHVEFPSHLSNECKHLISRMLVTHPGQRASMLEVKSHPWMVKGYDGAPDNYLPHRVPLTLPLDSEVIDRMKGFEFGSSEYIRTVIEEQVTRGLSTKQSFGGGDHSRAPETPLASIYYLVKEKMDRERRDEDSGVHEPPIKSAEDMEWDSVGILKAKPSVSFITDNTSSPQYTYTAPTSPSMARSNDPNGSPPGRPRSNSTGSVLRWDEDGRPPTAPSGDGRDSRDVKVIAAAAAAFRKLGSAVKNVRDGRDAGREERRERKENLNRLSRTMPRGNSVGSATLLNGAMSGNSSNSPATNGTTGGSSRNVSTPRRKSATRQIIRNPTTPGFGFRQQRDTPDDDAAASTSSPPLPPRPLLATTSDITEPPAGHILPGHETERQNSHSRLQLDDSAADVLSPDLGTPSGIGSRLAEGEIDIHDDDINDNSHMNGDEDQPPLPPRKGRADEHVRPVYLKGLFTVQNTSTKPASVIRDDLIRVLAMNGIRAEEYRGGFSCEYTPSVTGLVDGEKEKESRWKRLGDKMGERAQRLSERVPFGGGTGGFRDRARSRDRGERDRDRSRANRQRDRERIEAFWSRERGGDDGERHPNSAAGDLEMPRMHSDNDIDDQPSASLSHGELRPNRNAGEGDPTLDDRDAWYMSDDGFSGPEDIHRPENGGRPESRNSSLDDEFYGDGPPSPGYVDLSSVDVNGISTSPEMTKQPAVLNHEHLDDAMAQGGVDVSDAGRGLGVTGTDNKPLVPSSEDNETMTSANTSTNVTATTITTAVNDTHNGSPPLSSVAFATLPVPDLSVRFEVFIVKIPWLGLHGVQFRRIGGADIWLYKTIANRILEDLRL